MLAGSVDAFERLLVQQAGISEAVRHLFHHFHGQLVVVHCHVGRLKDRRQLVLGRSDLVVLGLGRHAELPEFFVQCVHVLRYLGLKHAKIVILHLLSLGRRRSHECAACKKEVFSLLVEFLVDQEILLLRAYSRVHMCDSGISEKVQYFDSCV